MKPILSKVIDVLSQVVKNINTVTPSNLDFLRQLGLSFISNGKVSKMV